MPGGRNVPSPQGSRSSLDQLIDFDDSGRLHNWRFLLPVREAGRALPIDINPRELFSVMVVDRDLPMTVLAPTVTPES
jgi:hypothetical protein